MDELHTGFQSVYELLGFFCADGFEDVSPVKDYVFAILVIVSHRVPPVTCQAVMRIMNTIGAGSVVIEIVRRTESFYKRLLQIGERAASVTQRNALRAVFLDHFLQIVRDVVERFFPARFLPFP